MCMQMDAMCVTCRSDVRFRIDGGKSRLNCNTLVTLAVPCLSQEVGRVAYPAITVIQ